MKLFDYTLRNRAAILIETYKKFIKKGSTVLDVGCGNGIVSKIISDGLECKITGTDIMDYRKVKIDFKKIEDDGKLPLKDQSFDFVMFNDVLHHMPYELQIKIIIDGLRVGKAVLIFELKPTTYAKFTDWFSNKIHNIKMRISLTQRVREEWENMFKENKIICASTEIKRKFPENPFELSYENLANLLYYPVTNYCFYLTKT